MIFFDCEFTSIEGPELLSIGLVTGTGKELYVELAGESHLIGASREGDVRRRHEPLEEE